MVKKFFMILVILSFNFIIHSYSQINYEEVKSVIDNSSDIQKSDFFSKIKSLKIDWKGYVLKIISFDETNDMIYLEMDKVKPDRRINQPDVCFLLNKKYSKKIDPYQQLYFTGEIENINFADNKYLIRINKINLKNLRM